MNEVTGISYKKTDGTVIESVSYTYDALGNPIRRSRSGAASKQETGFTATYDAANRMLAYNGLPLSYDVNGNLISRQTPSGTVTYTWDAKNQLAQISGPNGTAAFRYDHAGRRIEKTINGVTTIYLYDGNQAIGEVQGSTVGATYLTGLQIDEVLAIYSNKGNRTALTDALGSILALTDDTQATKTSYAYSPFGETQTTGETPDQPYQYTGRENDGTGLYYYRARYYDPEGKRFTSLDPIGLEGGINPYAYVSNNPLRWIDPSGLAQISIGGEASGHAVLVGLGIGGGVTIDDNGTICVYASGSLTFGLGIYAGAGYNVGGSTGSNTTGLSGSGGIFLEGGGGIAAGTEINIGSDGTVGGGKGFGGVGVGGAGGFRETGAATYCFNQPEDDKGCKK